MNQSLNFPVASDTSSICVRREGHVPWLERRPQSRGLITPVSTSPGDSRRSVTRHGGLGPLGHYPHCPPPISLPKGGAGTGSAQRPQLAPGRLSGLMIRTARALAPSQVTALLLS